MNANRRFAELCGICWHERVRVTSQGEIVCSCGKVLFPNGFDGHCKDNNSDFAADPRLVLREISPVDMEDFINFLLDGCPSSEPYGPTTIDCCLYLCDLFRDTTGQLRDRAGEWMERGKL